MWERPFLKTTVELILRCRSNSRKTFGGDAQRRGLDLPIKILGCGFRPFLTGIGPKAPLQFKKDFWGNAQRGLRLADIDFGLERKMRRRRSTPQTLYGASSAECGRGLFLRAKVKRAKGAAAI
jgi:hypothetical protein